jgi:peptidyl-dipeptidase A
VAGIDLDRYFAGKDLEDLTQKTFDGLGLDVRGVISSSDLYEREGKSQHAFCTRIGREYPYDVRVLANVRPDAYWMDAMLHESSSATPSTIGTSTRGSHTCCAPTPTPTPPRPSPS